MPAPFLLSSLEQLRPVLGSIRSMTVPSHEHADPASPPPPFVTISRQAGIDAGALAHRLMDRLNRQEADASEHPWTCWDRELVEKVAADQHLSRPLVESIEDGHHSWFTELLEGLRTHEESEQKAYYRIAATVRGLAKAGRVVLVGRGAIYVTQGMPGGVHFRLVAPQAWRIARVAQERGITPEAAGGVVRETDRNREAFLKQHWPSRSMTPEDFTATLNAAAIGPELLVEAMAMITLRASVTASATGSVPGTAPAKFRASP